MGVEDYILVEEARRLIGERRVSFFRDRNGNRLDHNSIAMELLTVASIDEIDSDPNLSKQEKETLIREILSYQSAILAENPTNAYSWGYMALTSYMMGDTDNALKYINNAIMLGEDPSSLLFRGFSLFGNLGRYDKALDDLRRAIELKPDYDAAYYRKAVILRKRGDYESALDEIDIALRMSPENGSYTAEKQRIENLMKEHSTSPMFMSILTQTLLLPGGVEAFLKNNGVDVDGLRETEQR